MVKGNFEPAEERRLIRDCVPKKVKHEVINGGDSTSSALSKLGVELDQTNVVTALPSQHKSGLQEGDLIIGVNSEPVLGRAVIDGLAKSAAAAAAATATVVLTVLRPKGRIALLGASVAAAGPRKQGGHILTISISDSASRRSRYNLVCADERLCSGWVASIKEAIAAAQMEEIKTAL